MLQFINFAETILLKRLITIFFVLALSAPFAVPFFLLHYQKQKVRKEVKELIFPNLKKEDMLMLSFSLVEAEKHISWHHSREFEYRDEMYDVIKKEYRKDSVIFWCYHDRKETDLKKRLDELSAQSLTNDPQKKEQQQRINNLLKIQYLSCNCSWNPFHGFSLPASYPEYIVTYQSILFSPPKPPPRSFS